jgi:hypothetical protein
MAVGRVSFVYCPTISEEEVAELEGETVKIRNLILGAIALVVLAGTVVIPANAAVHHRHHRRHHRHHRR